MKKGNMICFVCICFGLGLFAPYVSWYSASAQNSSSHMDTCLTCHNADDLHAMTGHEQCEQCHLVRGGANVMPDKCVTCHPLDGPGTCNLAVDHGSACIECHTECGGGSTTTTTASSSPGHIDMCLGCHGVDDLHAIESHATCSRCHTGDEVGVNACAVCHPLGDPGTCNLAVDHGSACIGCHTECGGGGTTTTTVSPSAGHIDMCTPCHIADTLHTIPAHLTCSQCHEGREVRVEKCIVCHPTDGPGTCNLAYRHGTSCLACHADCTENTTTTTSAPSTTTTVNGHLPVVEKVITTNPKEFFRSQFLPLPFMMLIAGDETNFNQTSKVSFDDDSLFPPLRFVLSRNRIFVFSILRPMGLLSTNDRELMVSVTSEVDSAESGMYEEVGRCTFYVVPLPF